MTDVDNDIIDLLTNIDQISLGELSPPSTYDFIRYSREPLLDTQASFQGFKCGSNSEAFALNFSNPPKEFRQSIEHLLDHDGEIGTNLDEWYRSSGKYIADKAVEAGRIGKNVQGAIGYVLMSDINEELSLQEYRESSQIPDYFFQKSDKQSQFYVFEGVLNGKRDIKIATITEDETAIAWFLGRALEDFDMDEEFKKGYNQRIEQYVENDYLQRI